jgi:hypothetical protein
MTIRLLLIFLPVLLLVSCSKRGDTRSTTHPRSVTVDSCIQSDEYTILSMLLDSSYADSDEFKQGVTSCMLIDSTIAPRRLPKRLTSPEFSEMYEQLANFALDSLLDCFNAINSRPAALSKDSLKCHFNVVLISETVLDSVFGGTIGALQNWPLFYKRYPHTRGLAQLSRVAFNNTRNQAVVYWEREREPLIGYGEIVFFARQAHAWIIVTRRIVWIS